MNLRKAFIGSAMVGAMVVGTTAVQAATFASFSFAGPSRFQLLPGGLFTVNTNVSFRFVGSGITGPSLPPSMVNQDYEATLSLTGFLVPNGGELSLLSGAINHLATITTFQIQATTLLKPDLSGPGMLLQGTLSSGLLSGSLGGTTAGLNFSTQGFLGGPISFSSDYIIFAPGTRGATFGLSDIKHNGTQGLQFIPSGPPFGLTLQGDVDQFDSSIAGSFDAEPRPTSVPEPGSVAMLIGFGVAGTAMVIRRRK
jgi:hypothetical protein